MKKLLTIFCIGVGLLCLCSESEGQTNIQNQKANESYLLEEDAGNGFDRMKIEVMKPADCYIPKGSTIAFVSMNNAYEVDTSALLFEYRRRVTEKFYEGINKQLISAGICDTVLECYRLESNILRKVIFPPRKDRDYIKELAKTLQCDYVIALEALGFEGEMRDSLVIDFKTRVYSGVTGNVLDSVSFAWGDVRYEIQWPICMLVDQMSESMGWDYAATRLMQSWETVDRRIAMGGRLMNMCGYWVTHGNYEEAEKYYDIIRSEGKLVPTIKVYMNLALIRELQNDFSGAQEYLRIALKKAETGKVPRKIVRYLKSYNEVIQERIEEVNKIDQQLGGEEIEQ